METNSALGCAIPSVAPIALDHIKQRSAVEETAEVGGEEPPDWLGHGPVTAIGDVRGQQDLGKLKQLGSGSATG